jgi:hypothetical protein
VASKQSLVISRPWPIDLRSTTSGRQAADNQRPGLGHPATTKSRPLVVSSHRLTVNWPGPVGDQPAGRGLAPGMLGLVLFLNIFY